MRAIEEFNYKGSIEEEPVSGMVTGYVKNIEKAIPKGLKKSILQNWEIIKNKLENIPENVVLYLKKNPDLYRRIIAGSFVILMATSFTGCKGHFEALENDQIAIENVMNQEEKPEERATIQYKIKFGDTLEGIVRSYTDSNIQKEINRICSNNGIENASIIFEGQVIKIDVPESALERFGYTASYGEVNEWDAMDYFVSQTFDIPASEINPQNISYWRDKKYVVGYLGEGAPSDIDFGNEKPLLMKAAGAIEDLKIMTSDQYGFYSDQDIKNMEAKINGYYNEAIEIAERHTGKKYGKDYILEPPIIAVSKDQTLNK